jgi:hypothetical protein
MSCDVCKHFVYDSLTQPIHPFDYYYKSYKHKRFMKIAMYLSEIVLDVLRLCDPSEYNNCRYMDPYNSYDTTQGHSPFGSIMSPRQYRDLFMSSIRIFLYFKRRNPQLHVMLKQVLYIAMEHCVLPKSMTMSDYEEWFAQKFIFLLLHFHSVHQEHMPKPTPLRIRITFVEEDSDLYL